MSAQYDPGAAYLDEVVRNFRGYKRLAEGALAQVNDEEFFAQLDPEANSMALVVKHISGNMRSRWTDFLTSDGDKPDRHRDTEFEIYREQDTRESLMQRWEAGYQLLFDAIRALTPADLGRTVTIRKQPHTVLQAINRQMAHYAYHVGQIALLAKHARGAEWKSLSIPRGMSEQFGQQAEQEFRKKQEAADKRS
jgi:uncharacterized damage-inducible protein DinB